MYDAGIMPEYVSTRSTGGEEPRTYGDVVIEGLAADRGLYVPTEYPSWSHDELKGLNGLPYDELFVRVKSFFVGGSIDLSTQQEHATTSYSAENFPDAEDGNVVPVREIAPKLYVQNLSLGPTAAFKDMALQPVAKEMAFELERRGTVLNILGATSGDTGSAAEAAVKGLANISLFMLSPAEGMSKFQSAQMGELSDERIHNITMPGRFGPLQDIVKDLNKEFDLGAVNSMNWGRVVSQIPYYVSGYLQAIEQSGGTIGDPVDFVVPSGNMGNALAAYLARKIGVPIRKIIIANNENAELHNLVQTGVYKNVDADITSSPSMDITKPSNYERVIHDILGNDPELTQKYMGQFEHAGLVDFRDIARPSDLLKQAGFDSGSSNHAKRVETIAWAHEQGTLIDPHTADGVWVARHQGGELKDLEVPTVCMETALPVKFEPIMEEALGFVPERPERFKGLRSVPGGFKILSGVVELKEYVRENLQS